MHLHQNTDDDNIDDVNTDKTKTVHAKNTYVTWCKESPEYCKMDSLVCVSYLRQDRHGCIDYDDEEQSDSPFKWNTHNLDGRERNRFSRAHLNKKSEATPC